MTDSLKIPFGIVPSGTKEVISALSDNKVNLPNVFMFIKIALKRINVDETYRTHIYNYAVGIEPLHMSKCNPIGTRAILELVENYMMGLNWTLSCIHDIIVRLLLVAMNGYHVSAKYDLLFKIKKAVEGPIAYTREFGSVPHSVAIAFRHIKENPYAISYAVAGHLMELQKYRSVLTTNIIFYNFVCRWIRDWSNVSVTEHGLDHAIAIKRVHKSILDMHKATSEKMHKMMSKSPFDRIVAKIAAHHGIDLHVVRDHRDVLRDVQVEFIRTRVICNTIKTNPHVAASALAHALRRYYDHWMCLVGILEDKDIRDIMLRKRLEVDLMKHHMYALHERWDIVRACREWCLGDLDQVKRKKCLGKHVEFYVFSKKNPLKAYIYMHMVSNGIRHCDVVFRAREGEWQQEDVDVIKHRCAVQAEVPLAALVKKVSSRYINPIPYVRVFLMRALDVFDNDVWATVVRKCGVQYELRDKFSCQVGS